MVSSSVRPEPSTLDVIADELFDIEKRRVMSGEVSVAVTAERRRWTDQASASYAHVHWSG